MSGGSGEFNDSRRSMLDVPVLTHVADSARGGTPRIKKRRRSTLDTPRTSLGTESFAGSNAGGKEKPARKKSKRHTEAEDGDLLSMVKIGWGLHLMLKTYNKKRVERGDSPVEQIDDGSILRLVESRKETQRKNTRKYQARRLADARRGNIAAARKLKWSVQRIKKLQLWISNGKIGQFEVEGEDGNSSSVDEEYQGDSDVEGFADMESVCDEREPSPEDNIQVASLPIRTWTEEDMVVAKLPKKATPVAQYEHSDVLIQDEYWNNDMEFRNRAAFFNTPDITPRSRYPFEARVRDHETGTATPTPESSIVQPDFFSPFKSQSHPENFIQADGKLPTLEDHLAFINTAPQVYAENPYQTDTNEPSNIMEDCFAYENLHAAEPLDGAAQYTTAGPEDGTRSAGISGMYQRPPPRYVPCYVHPEVLQAQWEAGHAAEFLHMEENSMQTMLNSIRKAAESMRMAFDCAEKANKKLADAYKRHSELNPNFGPLRSEFHGR